MAYSQLESITHMKQQIAGMKLLLVPICGINKALRFVGMGSKKLEEIRLTMKKIEKSLHEFQTFPGEFNKIFSDKGWVSYDSMNFDLMRDMVQISRKESINVAELKMLDSLKPKKIESDIFRLFCIPEIQIRRKLIELAFEDYVAERYHAVVPVLLMMIDGIVNDIVDKGFHTEQVDLNVWDSFTNIDGGIYKIREIFGCGRKKTRAEEINLPFRNGILHGMDLGYNNYIVAAKCWNFLFVVKDWAVSKQTEEQRKRKFKEETRIPAFRELADQFAELDKSKKALAEWEPRSITNDYIQKINNNDVESGTPEAAVIEFMDLWLNNNYGHMAQKQWSIFFHNDKPNINEVREQFSEWLLKTYVVTDICDEAPAISEFVISAVMKDECIMNFKIRMLYEKNDGYTLPRNLVGGLWKVVFVQVHESDILDLNG